MIEDWIALGVKGAYWFMDPSRISTFFVSSSIIVYACFRSLKTENELAGECMADIHDKKTKASDYETLNKGEPLGVDRYNKPLCRDVTTYSEKQASDGFQVLDSTQAILLPLGASVTLLLMFYFFDSMQIVLTLCTAGIACVSFAYLLLPCCRMCLRSTSEKMPLRRFPVKAVCHYNLAQLCSFVLALLFVFLWIVTGHWILMDALGLGLCVSFISYVKLPSLKVSIMLLLGLVVYDVFWVFFSSYIFKTNVMLRVATNSADNPMLVMARLHSGTKVQRQLELAPDKGPSILASAMMYQKIAAHQINYPSYPWKVIRGTNLNRSMLLKSSSHHYSAPKLSLPVKLLFPSSQQSGQFSMLGLGDIVMPGLLLCFLLRFDWHKKTLSDIQSLPSTTRDKCYSRRSSLPNEKLPSSTLPYYYEQCRLKNCHMHHESRTKELTKARESQNIDKCVTKFRWRRMSYFHCSLIGYLIGLIIATLSSEIFNAAQPALLYLVPFTLFPILVMAHIKGDLKKMWDEPFAINPCQKEETNIEKEKLLEII